MCIEAKDIFVHMYKIIHDKGKSMDKSCLTLGELCHLM